MTDKPLTDLVPEGHTFHLPILGTAFSVEAALKISRYGISTVLSLVDDLLLEQMRELHCRQRDIPYEAIGADAEDRRARRVTAYLNQLGEIVKKQTADLREAPFEEGSEITRYFDLLPDGPLRSDYLKMKALPEGAARDGLEKDLRGRVRAGSIDVNIMTKLDRLPTRNGEPLPQEQSDAMAALRGFALSTLRSAMVFSAGMHPRLYSYVAQFDDFFPDESMELKKKLILKVSDYRSAEIQGRFLAKRGLWVSEFRIESALNCGGHTFPSNGLLMGPILEEFKSRRGKLTETLHQAYSKALGARGRTAPPEPLPLRITVQGGIGTAREDRFLREHFEVEGTGWGTPFLLVPEATTVDEAHLEKLTGAAPEDVYLSRSSPMGLPFWNLRTSASEEMRRQHIADGRPGSACPKGHLRFNTDLTEKAVCLAARSYQKRRLAALPGEGLSEKQLPVVREDVVTKSCICHDLAGAAMLVHNIDSKATPAICCGPGILHYSRTATLDEMVGHIYGRLNLLKDDGRPHMFLKEFELYISYLAGEVDRHSLELPGLQPKQFAEIRENLRRGADYYREHADDIAGDDVASFRRGIDSLSARIDGILIPEK